MLYNTILTTISELLDQLLLIINSRELCWLDYSVQYNLLFEYFASSPLLFLPCFEWRCFHYCLLSSHVRNGLALHNTKGDVLPIFPLFLNHIHQVLGSYGFQWWFFKSCAFSKDSPNIQVMQFSLHWLLMTKVLQILKKNLIL